MQGQNDNNMCLVYSIPLNNKEPKDGKNIKEKEMGLMLNNNKGGKGSGSYSQSIFCVLTFERYKKNMNQGLSSNNPNDSFKTYVV